MSEERRPVPFVDVLYAMPALWGRLLAEHTPDPTGRRCQACTTAGTGSPGAAWPCRIRDAAESARARYLSTTSAEVHPLQRRRAI
ncbi:MAG TPA: hypothetical protein VNO83_00385 [Pseudonocardia sp.]|nr:hypothetical protein [Pseudonocardia sp.]